MLHRDSPDHLTAARCADPRMPLQSIEPRRLYRQIAEGQAA